jgi:transcriptional regulator with XRE-family HTH domain
MSDIIAERLKKARKNMGLSTTQVFKDTGISEGNLSEWENGHCNPTVKNLLKLSKEYCVSIDWLLTGESNHHFDITKENKDTVLLLQRVLTEWEQGDEATRGWVIVQLRKAFPEIVEEIKGKGQN